MQTTDNLEKRFVRRTKLTAGESRCNFRQTDNDALCVLKSREARKVTNLMMHIYMCLIDAPFRFRQSEGELYFNGEDRNGKHITAWEQLIEVLEVADGTAHKALTWMHAQAVIGYHPRKNGVGIRIFLNRAVASIKQTSAQEQKNLPNTPIANGAAHVSPNAMPFKKNPRKNEDIKINTFAPENGAGAYVEISIDESATDRLDSVPCAAAQSAVQPNCINTPPPFLPAHSVAQLRSELRSELHSIAAQAAVREATREAERTRQWLDKFGIPKAARVAQREAYSVFKHQAAKIDSAERTRAGLQVGRSTGTHSQPQAKPLTTTEITQIANGCVAVLEVQGKAIDTTLAEISVMSGGWATEEDVAKVRESANALLLSRNEK